MIEPKDKDLQLQQGPFENKKRKREVFFVVFISLLFVLLTWFEMRLFGISQQLPFVHSIFFFGLVNFNIILLLLLLFLIFRNVVKVFVERRGKIIGSSLKAKLIAAFVAFSFIPTVLMFLISVFYINSSFDKWFSVKMAGVLKGSLEVTNSYYFNAKKRNYHFAHEVAQSIANVPLSNTKNLTKKLQDLQRTYNLDAVEYYPNLFDDRILVLSEEESIPEIPSLSLEFLQKGIKNKTEASTIHQFGEGNLVRVIVPLDEKSELGAVVISSYVPLSLMTKMNDITAAYEDFRDINPLEYPLKSIYTIILFLMTLVILLCATWFGFYLAKQLSIPLVLVGRASRRVAEGDYSPVQIDSGSEEIHELIHSFNQMTQNLEQSEKKVKDAHRNLQITLDHLDKHSRYIEIVLANVSAGIISVDPKGNITTMNRRAATLLNVDESNYIGHHAKELFSRENYKTFLEVLKHIQEKNLESIQKEVTININDHVIPLQVTLSILRDEKKKEVARILVFDDLSMIVNAQRAAAWSEVAKRIAHEIKNPLTPIKLSAERLQRKFGQKIEDPAFTDCTQMIIKQTDELRHLVNEFSQFARLPEANKVPVALNPIVEEALTIFKTSHPKVTFEFSKDENLPIFKMDKEQIKRVLINLVDNAIQAIPPETKPHIKISTKYDKNLQIASLSVIDNGKGIPVDDRLRIFEPYYSTKETGTGLGLPIVKRIIEDHNGFIRALSVEPDANPQDGTKMLIELPVLIS